jgi:glycosyltransferase involved in cell wall biosynthesis
VPTTSLLALAVVTTVVLAATLVDFAFGLPRLRSLGSVEPAATLPPLSIIVAARNEARHIAAAVSSLLALDYPALEIVVVNDRSTDATAAILKRLARGDPRLKITHIAELPDGWLGKNYALASGAELASSPLLLFTDADVVFEPTAVKRAVTVMVEDRLDHLTAIPHATVPGVALRAFVAAFGVFFSVYTRPWKARDPRSRRHIGIGAFNLLRADVYRAIGTHRTIAMRPDDDIKLGKVIKARGFRQDVVDAHEYISVEWYASLRELVDGLMKNAFAGVNYSLLAVAGSTAALLLTFVFPLPALLLTHGLARVLNGLSVILTALVFFMSARRGGVPYGYVLAFPLAALLFAYIIWRSALLAVVSGRVVWRGTAYPLAELRANRV